MSSMPSQAFFQTITSRLGQNTGPDFVNAGLNFGGEVFSGFEQANNLSAQIDDLRAQQHLSNTIAEQNINFALEMGEFNAGAAMVRARAEERRVRREGLARLGATSGRFAGSGVDIGVGAPIQALARITAENELDAQTVKYIGREQAKRARFEAETVAHRERVRNISSNFLTDLRADAAANAGNRAIVGGFLKGAQAGMGSLLS